MKLLTSDVARILECSPAFVQILARTGQIPAEKTPGGVHIFDRDDVLRVARERAERRAIRKSRRG